jgi:hypothetical protein
MTPDHIYKVVSKYEIQLEARGHKAEKTETGAAFDNPTTKLNHTLWMCQQIRAFVTEGELEKANRWLGFVQGVLWAYGIYTVDQMRDDNR